MRKYLMLAALALSPSTAKAEPVYANDISITKGRLSVNEYMASQMISVKNNSTEQLEKVAIECGFFHRKTLIASDSETVTNLNPNETAYVRVTAWQATDADSTDCRLVGYKLQKARGERVE